MNPGNGCLTGNKMESLDVRNLANLSTLDCSNNSLTSIDLSNNKMLLDLNCSFNMMRMPADAQPL